MVLSINQKQREKLKAFESANDYVGEWRYLASIGDTYADNAYAVVGASIYSEGRLFSLLVRYHWGNTAGPEAYEHKFAEVALQHFTNYVRIIDRNEGGRLPTTEQIERSYRNAVESAGLNAYTAFDGVFTQSIGRLTGKSTDWADFLGIDAARQVESHVFDDLDSTKSWKLVGSALSTAYIANQGELQVESSRATVEALGEVLNSFSEALVNVRERLNELPLPAGAFTEPFAPQIIHPVVAPTTAPQTPVDAPLGQISATPTDAKRLDIPLQPAQPSPLVETINQNPQRPTSVNPDKPQSYKPKPKTKNKVGGSGNKEDNYSRTNRSSDYSSGIDNSKTSTRTRGVKGSGATQLDRISIDSKGRVWPVLLDLSGNGLAVDPLSSSSFFVDLDGSGYLHRMASPGAGTGMLVLDIGGDGRIGDASEFVFTEWDKSATGDLEALRNVFDTNGNGKLDAGDARWSEFKVMADGKLVSLDALGIASIDLTPKGSGQSFGDGSAILGTTTFTRKDGSTGTVGDAVLAADSNGYIIRRSTTAKADGSAAEDILGYAPDGRLAFRTLVTRSAGGQATLTQFDDDGNGTFDRSQRIETATDADGIRRRTVSNFNADGSLRDRTITVTGTGGRTVTTTIDQDGDGIADQSEVFTTNADRSTVTVTRAIAADGTLLGEIKVSGSADGLSKTTSSDENGDGRYDAVLSDRTVINADRSRARTVETRNADGTLRDRVTTTTSGDGRKRSILSDFDGNGVNDEREEIRISAGDGGTTTTDIATYAQNGSLLGREETTTSADGKTTTTRSDLDGDAATDRTTTTATVTLADGATTETETVASGNATLLSRVVTKRSADGKLVTTETDGNGDGAIERLTTIKIAADGTTTEEIAEKHPNGTLAGRSVKVTKADGLSWTRTTDIDGNGTTDRTESAATIVNADGSRTETLTVKSSNGSLVGQSVTTTSADSLTQTVKHDLTGDGVADLIAGDRIILNADGTRTETIDTRSGKGTLLDSATTTVSADRKTTTTAVDANGDGAIARHTVSATAKDGSVTVTDRSTAANGTLLAQSKSTTSRDGLKQVLLADTDGNGTFERETVSETVLGTDGSRSRTETVRAGTTLIVRTVSKSSDDGFTASAETDANGDGIIDLRTSETKRINADGSVTTTVKSQAGTTLVGSTEMTSSGNGLTQTVRTDADGNGTVDATATSARVLQANGSTTDTLTVLRQDGALKTLEKAVVEISADELSVTQKWDLNGDGSFERSRTDVTKRNADGSVARKVSELSGSASTRQTETTTSANGLSVTRKWDLDGNGSYDQTSTDVTVLNANGSVTRTVTSTKADASQIAKSVETQSADGRSRSVKEDRTALGLPSRSLVSLTSTLADGATVGTLSILDAAGKLIEKQTTTASADGRESSIVRDADGDGKTDQTEAYTRSVDGSQSTVMTGYTTSGAKLDSTTITTSADGRTTTTSWDLDGNGTADRQRTTVVTVNADGSESAVSTDTAAAGTVQSKSTTKTSADGRTEVVSRDLNGDGVNDSTETTVTDLSGATVTTIVNNAEARSYLIDSDVDWKEAIAAKSETAISADGLSRTTRSDFDGNGTFEYVEVAATQIDGSIIGTITETNSAGKTVAKGTRMESADGRTVKLDKDDNNDGTGDRTQTAVTHLTGAVTLTTIAWDAKGTVKETVTESFSATGKLTRRLTTDAAGKNTGELLLLADGTMTDSAYDGASGKLLSVTKLSKDGVPASAVLYDPLGSEKWKEIAQTFDTAGKLTKQEQTNDDGTKVTDWFDVADAQTWDRQTYFYDAAGAQTQRSWIYDDKTKTNIYYDTTKTKGYSSLTQTLDAAGKMTKQEEVKDDGTKQVDWYDVAAAKTWTQQTDLFDKAGVRTQSSFVNDDGTKTNTFYDATSTKGYSSLTQYLDTAGKLTKQVEVKDDGTKQTDWYDIAAAKNWTQQTDLNDAAGALTQRTYLNDDKTKTVTFYDAAKTKSYSSLTQYLDTAGKLTKQVQTNDDSTKQTDWYDLADAQAWWQQTDWNDASGALTQRSYLDDSKTRVTTKYDPGKTQTWTTIVENFDATGKMTTQVQTNDDGTKETTTYDAANAQNWSQLSEIIDASGTVTQRSWWYDDKSKLTTLYDGFKSTEKYYNAAGQQTRQIERDGFSYVNYTTYDFDNSKTWSKYTEEHWATYDYPSSTRETKTYWDDGRITSGKPPVLLDLNGDDHIDLRQFDPSAADGPAFDWDGDGMRDGTAWFGPEDGILAIDLGIDGSAGPDGLIDQARELAFASWVEDGSVNSDLEGLRLVFDTNRDNVLDMRDARWDEFRVWQDHNQNGVTDSGELSTMPEAGIRLVNLLPSTDGAKAFEDGSMITGTATMTMADGSTRLVADTTLAYRPSQLNSQVA